MADPLIVPDVAVIVAVPCAMLVASPPLLTVATEVAEEESRWPTCQVLGRAVVVGSGSRELLRLARRN